MPTIELPPIVIDTNVLISAGLLPASRSAQALAIAVEHFVIARTIEGKGLDLMENQTGWHLGYLTPEDSEIAAQEILSKEI